MGVYVSQPAISRISTIQSGLATVTGLALLSNRHAQVTMGILNFFRQLYSLDTLDTRFTSSTKTPSKIANEESTKTAVKDVKSADDIPQGASPAKWYTKEFYFYALVFIVAVPQMYFSVVEVSLSTKPLACSIYPLF